jgi:hypothetical protein
LVIAQPVSGKSFSECFGPSGLGERGDPRPGPALAARFSPGYHIAGFQPWNYAACCGWRFAHNRAPFQGNWPNTNHFFKRFVGFKMDEKGAVKRLNFIHIRG